MVKLKVVLVVAALAMTLGIRAATAAPAPINSDLTWASGEQRPADWDISGPIVSMNGQFWDVNGFVIRVTDATRITGEVPAIGSTVDVEGIVGADGTWLAQSVRIREEEDTPTPTGSATASPTAVQTGTVSPTATPTTTAIATSTAVPTGTATSTATPVLTLTATATSTPIGSITPTATHERDDDENDDRGDDGEGAKPTVTSHDNGKHIGPPPFALRHGEKRGFENRDSHQNHGKGD